MKTVYVTPMKGAFTNSPPSGSERSQQLLIESMGGPHIVSTGNETNLIAGMSAGNTINPAIAAAIATSMNPKQRMLLEQRQYRYHPDLRQSQPQQNLSVEMGLGLGGLFNRDSVGSGTSEQQLSQRQHDQLYSAYPFGPSHGPGIDGISYIPPQSHSSERAYSGHNRSHPLGAAAEISEPGDRIRGGVGILPGANSTAYTAPPPYQVPDSPPRPLLSTLMPGSSSDMGRKQQSLHYAV